MDFAEFAGRVTAFVTAVVLDVSVILIVIKVIVIDTKAVGDVVVPVFVVRLGVLGIFIVIIENFAVFVRTVVMVELTEAFSSSA